MTQLRLFDPDATPVGVALEDLFSAYYACRRGKRRTHNALAFELDYESQLVRLCDEINDGAYRPGRSVAFIVDEPVKREIFAAEFRDRVVHHLLIAKLNPSFEKAFIYDSYACRVGKGTLFGIRRVQRFIRECSVNYSSDCYVLKLDIRGFFMNINIDVLYGRLERFVNDKYRGQDREVVLRLSRQVLFTRPVDNCVIKGDRRDWVGLPNSKSLFHSPLRCGLPIGNLSSQVFANFYLNALDHFVKHDLGVRFYGRYVDDLVIVHRDREYLLSLIGVLREFLQTELALELHPDKIYLQHYEKGVNFLGVVIKPHRVYVGQRTKGNFVAAIQHHNAVLRRAENSGVGPTLFEKQAFVATVNSYLGLMKHHNTRRLRYRTVRREFDGWWRYVYTDGNTSKVSLKPSSNCGVRSGLCNPSFRCGTLNHARHENYPNP